jgi:hypothetical protein
MRGIFLFVRARARACVIHCGLSILVSMETKYFDLDEAELIFHKTTLILLRILNRSGGVACVGASPTLFR